MSMTDYNIELLALFEAGEATDTQVSELKHLLNKDPSFLARAGRQNEMHALLSVALEDDVSKERALHAVLDKVKKADAEQFTNGVETCLIKLRWRRRMLTTTSIAALLMILLIAGFHVSSPQSLVATIQQANGIQWSDTPLNDGSALREGDSIKIDKGMLELNLAGRGRLIVEGPAHLEFINADHSILHRGRVVMNATKKGQGYTIETIQGRIIDVGTEFGVTVGSSGLVETHVIKGSIEAIPNGGESIILVGNDGLRMGPHGNAAIKADSSQYYTLMPPRHTSPPKYIHWGFDESEGTVASSIGELAADLGTKAKMTLHGLGGNPAPSWVTGATPQSGTALGFDGTGCYAESGYRGISGSKPRTVCFWLKVPEDFAESQGFGILSWGKHDRPGEVWQLSVNPLRKSGPVGRLRLGLIGGQIIGSTDLRDGEWHHISVVMYGGSRPNVGTHVILYVDGEQEQVSSRALQEVLTKTDQAEHGVWIGRNSASRPSHKQHLTNQFFRGELDELYIFDSALSQDELWLLMKQ